MFPFFFLGGGGSIYIYIYIFRYVCIYIYMYVLIYVCTHIGVSCFGGPSKSGSATSAAEMMAAQRVSSW